MYIKFGIQVIWWIAFLAIGMFILYTAYKDYKFKLKTKQESILYEMEQCKEDYNSNECQPETRRQALKSYCALKEICMNRDPFKEALSLIEIGKLAGEFLNSFFAALNVRTMCCLSLLIMYPIVFGFRYRPN